MNATCDQCGPGVSAKSVVTLANGGTLTFCGHCTDVHRERLERDGADILDERDVE